MTAIARRNLCIWAAFLVFAIEGLRPPWREVLATRESSYPLRAWPRERAMLDHPPGATNANCQVYVDYPRMWTEIAVGEALILALYLTWARK